jgi:AraC-like DNA-binding protein
MKTLPRLQVVMCERQSSASYRHEGRFRTAERHCIFKYTMAGEGRFRHGGEVHRLPVGTGFLCEVCDPSTAYWYPPEAREFWDFVYVCFIGALATATVREFTSRHGCVFSLPMEQGIVPELLAWRRHDGQEVPIAPAEGAEVVSSLLAALSRSRVENIQEDAGRRLTARVRARIEVGLRENLNVKVLASESGVSREHLSRVFREQTAQSPYQYIVRRRMLEACRLLKESDTSQKVIAEQLGYAEHAHFTRTFSRVMHMTPSRFRAVGTIPVR